MLVELSGRYIGGDVSWGFFNLVRGGESLCLRAGGVGWELGIYDACNIKYFCELDGVFR